MEWLESLSPVERKLLQDELKFQFEKKNCENSLAEFIKAAWDTLEPETPLIWNWHMDTLCAYLEAAFWGRISPRLIINIPPGTMKSLTVSVMFPAWCWLHRPGMKFLCGSNGQSLATRDAVKQRNLCSSDWYQERWGDKVQMNPAIAGKELFANQQMGERQSQGVLGAVTGKRGDCVIWDDSHDSKKTETADQLVVITDAWDSAWSTRVNSLDNSLRIIVMQRVHFKDITGHLMKKTQQGWVVLAIPMRYDSEVTYDAGADIGRPDLNDPRTEEGELMFPQRFSEKAVSDLELDLGSYRTAGQLQQRPSPKSGGEMRREWLSFYKVKPKHINCVIICDPAGERKQGVKGKKDNSAIGVIGINGDGNKYLLDGHRARYNLEERTRILFAQHRKYKPNAVFYERYGMQTDLVYIRAQMELLDYRFKIFELGGSMSKEDRIRQMIPTFSRGEFWLPETLMRTNTEGEVKDIIDDFVEIEYLPFPVGEFDDFFDMLARSEDQVVKDKLMAPMKKKPRNVARGHKIKNKSVGY